MTEKARTELDALDLLMQDHREIEALFRDFAHLQKKRMDTTRVISTACAELKMHDTLETQVFYAAVGEAADDERIDRLLGDAEAEHDAILELIENLERTRDIKERNAQFARLARIVEQHVQREEEEHFALVKALERLDMDALTIAVKERRAELLSEMTVMQADEETVQA